MLGVRTEKSPNGQSDPVTGGVVALEQRKVPTVVRRRAAQHLESIRGTPIAPYADDATLGSEVWPIYRPDLDEIAYYEFTVEMGSKARRLATTAAGMSALISAQRDTARSKARRPASGARITRPEASIGQGFIIVASGPHDFPIPHWSLDRSPISAQLAAAAEQAGAIKRITKVDSLAYVAESKDDALVAQVGQLPALLAGLPHDLGRVGGETSILIANPARDIPNDDKAEGVEHRAEREGPPPPDLRPIEVDGWPAMRERYADTFGPYLDDLRRQAAGAWEIERLIEEFGEGIHVGQTHRVALLHPEAVVDLAGEGASLANVHIDERAGGAALVIEVPEGTVLDQEADLEVDLRYPDGVSERLRFFLVSPSTPSNRRTMPSEAGR